MVTRYVVQQAAVILECLWRRLPEGKTVSCNITKGSNRVSFWLDGRHVRFIDSQELAVMTIVAPKVDEIYKSWEKYL